MTFLPVLFLVSLIYLSSLLYLFWVRICRRSCDACRLGMIDKLNVPSISVPHTCPLARYRFAVHVRKDGRKSEFGKLLSRQQETVYNHQSQSSTVTKTVTNTVMKGDKRNVRKIEEYKQEIKARQQDRRNEKEVREVLRKVIDLYGPGSSPVRSDGDLRLGLYTRAARKWKEQEAEEAEDQSSLDGKVN